jgi:hypothetical protein
MPGVIAAARADLRVGNPRWGACQRGFSSLVSVALRPLAGADNLLRSRMFRRSVGLSCFSFWTFTLLVFLNFPMPQHLIGPSPDLAEFIGFRAQPEPQPTWRSHTRLDLLCLPRISVGLRRSSLSREEKLRAAIPGPSLPSLARGFASTSPMRLGNPGSALRPGRH